MGMSLCSKLRERGAAAVEFALVLPLLLLVIGGVVDFGRALYTEIILTNAVREGARAAVMSTATLTQVKDRVVAGAPGFSAADLTVGMPLSCSVATPTNARVTVSTQFTWIILEPAMNLVGAGSNLPQTLSAEAAMKCGG
jgi:Flp pilus assembly protein TadG